MVVLDQQFSHSTGSRRYAIFNMRIEPLMLLHEKLCCTWAKHEYELFRLDPPTKIRVPVCRVVRTAESRLKSCKHRYGIQLDSAAAELGAVHELGPVRRCRCPESGCPLDFGLTLNRRTLAQICWSSMSMKCKHEVMLSSSTDVLLSLESLAHLRSYNVRLGAVNLDTFLV